MAITYTVAPGRKQKMTFQGANDAVSVTWHQTYFVDVSGYTNIDEIDAYNVITATGLPVVNRSIYEIDDKVIPFVICRNKTAKPMEGRQDRWQVDTQFKSTVRSQSEESDNIPISPPASLSNITPRVVPELGETEKVLYMDKSDFISDPDNNPGVITGVDCTRTPAGSFWEQPVMEKIPTLVLKITQYESSITYEQMLERKFKVNQGSYRSQPRYDWLILDVEAVEVDVILAGGPTTAALVTYTVAHSPHLYGWKQERALFDTQYFDSVTGIKKLFQNDVPGSNNIGYITSTGANRASQVGEPDYLQYESFDEIDFDSFLLA